MLLDVHGKQYKLLASYKERDVVRTAGGVWDARHGWWVLPSLSESLLSLSNLQISEAASERIFRERQKHAELRRLHSVEDVPLRYGDQIDPYQRVGAKFLAVAGRAILADHPGLGKSAQAIRAACEVGAEKVLVVTRKSLIHNWEQQFALWLPDSVSLRYDITNYEQVVKRLEDFTKQRCDVLIVDECTQVKSRKAQRSQAVFKLAQAVPYVWLLTGTPVLNRPDELWMPLHIIDPQRYRSYWRFVEEYCLLEYNPWSGGRRVKGLDPAKSAKLAEELSLVLLRRTREVVNLPPITRETVFVEMTGEQKHMYDSMLKEFFVVLSGAKLVYAPTVVAQLVRLRQITCTPALVGGPETSAKTNALLEIVEDYAGDYKILVFSTFARYVEILIEKMRRYKAVKITGGMTPRQRGQAVDTFNNDPACRVLVGTIGAMGEGLNLQGADIVIFTDKSWVPASVEQAESRSHRRGREKPVHVITLVASGTVDEHVEAVLNNKQEIISEVDAVTRLIALMQSKGGV